jgi:hypothetical protein
MTGNPAAFMCYARFDDGDGNLSEFRRRLASEVQSQTGHEFAIFQDRDIAWGQNWRKRIDEALDAVTLLLVFVSPGLFRSEECRQEIDRFLRRERELGRTDLILPIYYISARELDDRALRDCDPLASLLASRQQADWRALRFEDFTSRRVRLQVAGLASRMSDSFWLPPRPPVPRSLIPVQAPPVEPSPSYPQLIFAGGRVGGQRPGPFRRLLRWRPAGRKTLVAGTAAMLAVGVRDRGPARPGTGDLRE